MSAFIFAGWVPSDDATLSDFHAALIWQRKLEAAGYRVELEPWSPVVASPSSTTTTRAA